MMPLIYNFIHQVQDFIDAYQGTWAGKIVNALLTAIFFYLVYRITNRFIAQKIERNSLANSARQATVIRLLRSAFNYFILFFAIYTILTNLGFPVSTLIASAGIAGVALGLGVKDFITDVINGFFILTDNYFEVGEIIAVDDRYKGVVERMGIRMTKIRAFDGAFHFIPNSEIRVVSNFSRGDARILVDLPLDLTQIDLEVESIVKETTAAIFEEFQAAISQEPTVIGYIRRDNDLFYRIVFFINNNNLGFYEGQFTQAYLKALSQKGIALRT